MCGRLNESFEGRNENLKLDTTDLKLLEAIYGLQNLKTSDIAEKTGLSEITVKRRLRNLRKRG
ncbi:MAG: winged helix-turn-helix transcriptional regulator, partial [Candidatus Baldrarchaeia archaeon]